MTAVLFDFFGTLVDYSRDWTTRGYRRSHALAPRLSYQRFLTVVDDTFAQLERRCAADDGEFSMRTVSIAVLAAAGSAADPAVFEDTFTAEWQGGVTVPPGLSDLLRELATRHRLAVVSNTHSSTMVPGYLDEWGVRDLFDAVVLSVDVGRRKPDPLIYRTALDRIGVAAGAAVFVGDTFGADYLGPTAHGIPAFLIDPDARADVPADRRIASVFDLPGRLG